MRGRPFIEWLVFAILWMALLWPISALTGRRETRPAIAQGAGERRTADTWAALRFSSPPVRFAVRQGDRLLWEGRGAYRHEASIRPEAFDARLDLWLDVEWAEAAPSRAVAFTLEPDGRPSRSQTLWCDDVPRWEGVVSFVW